MKVKPLALVALALSLAAAVWSLLYRVYMWPVPHHIPLLAFPEVLLNAAALGLSGVWFLSVFREGKWKALVAPGLLLVFVATIAVNTSSLRWNYHRFAKTMRANLEKQLFEWAREEGLTTPEPKNRDRNPDKS